MRLSWKLGRVAGIDVYVHPTFLFILLFPQVTAWGAFGLALVLTGFGCVLLHELGHALMARQFGIATEDITLYPIGGVARLQRMPRSPGAELLIALAGPAVNVAIVGVIVTLSTLGAIVPGSLPWQFISSLLVVNAVLALFNLIPAFPMDGGRVLRAALSGWIGRLNATRIAAGLGRGLALAFGFYCLINGLLMQTALAAFIFLAAGTELRSVERETSRDRHEGAGQGIWVAPPGYCWVEMGDGAWQLAPIVVTRHERNAPSWH